uniref:F-box/FBD/LRR-repeat protein At1g13570-like n=1 Tax=Erigeron canadensis TaxID=72917 RepID=UPI001CB8E455|nr:F-box/FBD/LRR-repeat protein At1g13570-like [Erigeron canadensis]
MNTVKHLVLGFAYGYKLPHSFFSLNELEVLELNDRVFDPPLRFNGFPKLRRLSLHGGQIKAKKLLHLLTYCPLLEEVALTELYAEENFEGANECTFAELLRCVPLVRTLEISKDYTKNLVVAPTPHRLSTPLVRLKNLDLDMCLME